MTPFNGDITQCLKWLQNNAPNLQMIVSKKSNWYQQYHNTFWSNWQQNVFDIQTANTFGLMIWCIILNVPADLFGLFPANVSWAYGANRQNYIAKESDSPTVDPNTTGGNFYGGGNSTILNLNEVRWALQLRYVALVSDGRTSFINEMLRFIFNEGEAWDFAGGKYFYLADSTITPSASVPAITTPHYMEYRVGPNMGISSQFINLLNSQEYGVAPSVAGVKYLVVQE
jgi:Protein of unknown function (DUF2612)